MLENSNEYGSFMDHAPARDFASFIRTMNMATQLVTEDGTNTDMQATGVVNMVINGVHAVYGATAALDISGDLQLTEWLSGATYTTAHMRYVVNPSGGHKQWYKCILGHTAAAANKPDENDLRADAVWKTYWTRSTQTAEQASGDVVPTLYSRYYLALTQHAANTLTIVKAGPIALAADVELVIPNFEPEVFCAIASIKIDAPAGGFIMGSTDLDPGTVATFVQLIGPVFPTGAGIDGN